jgi:hypothetical protein
MKLNISRRLGSFSSTFYSSVGVKLVMEELESYNNTADKHKRVEATQLAEALGTSCGPRFEEHRRK